MGMWGMGAHGDGGVGGAQRMRSGCAGRAHEADAAASKEDWCEMQLRMHGSRAASRQRQRPPGAVPACMAAHASMAASSTALAAAPPSSARSSERMTPNLPALSSVSSSTDSPAACGGGGVGQVSGRQAKTERGMHVREVCARAASRAALQVHVKHAALVQGRCRVAAARSATPGHVFRASTSSTQRSPCWGWDTCQTLRTRLAGPPAAALAAPAPAARGAAPAERR